MVAGALLDLFAGGHVQTPYHMGNGRSVSEYLPVLIPQSLTNVLLMFSRDST